MKVIHYCSKAVSLWNIFYFPGRPYHICGGVWSSVVPRFICCTCRSFTNAGNLFWEPWAWKWIAGSLLSPLQYCRFSSLRIHVMHVHLRSSRKWSIGFGFWGWAKLEVKVAITCMCFILEPTSLLTGLTTYTNRGLWYGVIFLSSAPLGRSIPMLSRLIRDRCDSTCKICSFQVIIHKLV